MHIARKIQNFLRQGGNPMDPCERLPQVLSLLASLTVAWWAPSMLKIFLSICLLLNIVDN